MIEVEMKEISIKLILNYPLFHISSLEIFYPGKNISYGRTVLYGANISVAGGKCAMSEVRILTTHF